VKTDHSVSGLNIVNLPKVVGVTSALNVCLGWAGRTVRQVNLPLLAETVILTTGVICVIGIFSRSSFSGTGWFVVPATLAVAAVTPAAVKKSAFPDFGLSLRQITSSLQVLAWVCLLVFPAMFGLLWLLKSYGLLIPLPPVLVKSQSRVAWLLYQFLYVAVAEEMFFRGYLQNNILSIISSQTSSHQRLCQWISIVVSASVFAAAHVVVLGQIISVLTFLPGLVLGWLLIRTKSLLAPILFHGISNVCYLVIVTSLA
jgi:membrane protease YdiL (CAAX protease family)